METHMNNEPHINSLCFAVGCCSRFCACSSVTSMVSPVAWNKLIYTELCRIIVNCYCPISHEFIKWATNSLTVFVYSWCQSKTICDFTWITTEHLPAVACSKGNMPLKVFTQPCFNTDLFLLMKYSSVHFMLPSSRPPF